MQNRHPADIPEQLFELLPVATYVCDSEGMILRYNRRAAELWGRAPRIEDFAERFCGSSRLYRLDGHLLPRMQSPMAEVLRSGCPVRDREFVLERPDGSRRVVLVSIDVLRDANGSLVGGMGCLLDISDRPWNQNNVVEQEKVEEALRVSEARYRSLFNSIDEGFCVIEVIFDDADRPIDYVFLEVNQTFEALTGLHNVVGRRMRALAPEHEQHWFDAYGRIALTGAPERFELQAEALGRWYDVYAFRFDAPKLRRVAILFDDITERRNQQQQQSLLLREMDHRIKNLFAITSSVVSLSARSSHTSEELVKSIRGRLAALTIAHELVRPELAVGKYKGPRQTTIAVLIRELFAPYARPGENHECVTVQGPDVPIGGGAITSLALVLHEFVTNSVKYGALQSAEGFVEVNWVIEEDKLRLRWQEHGGPSLKAPPQHDGFGSLLARRSVEGQLGGELSRDWPTEGLVIQLIVPVARLVK